MSVGYDHVDTAQLRARGIRLGNTPGVLTNATVMSRDCIISHRISSQCRLSSRWRCCWPRHGD